VLPSAQRLSRARNRKFADSPLEETVRSELVSEMGRADSGVFMDDKGSLRAQFGAQIRWKLVLVGPPPVLLLRL
jgi:hypothetical protein